MSAQLPLLLRWPHRQRFEFFHPGGNAAALAAVRRAAETEGAPWVYLHGPAGSGRSHLLLAACQAASVQGRRAQYLPLGSLSERAEALRGSAGAELLALDELEHVAGDRAAEHALFDLYNATRAAGGCLLFAAAAAPAGLGIELPDLRSRLGACVRFLLQPLDEPARREVVRRYAAERGLHLDAAVLDWLFVHESRELDALFGLLDRLDRASLAARRRVTVPFLRDWLRRSTGA
ncbi:DnaA regulatory inactivator Hda [Aerosticca soli]|uniref:Chromosomal replication initiator protein DnaA n=1 Tax=Aerosticca soli TaxID=2010829 RepID=A0A2Z6E4M7_9GAMM|nr:DnaA regulatory inactivator Hda [Aerosticca soli]MDI3262029.1 DnaA regulatory inactivator Hda [Fulvimonas sp.]BBD79508.1 chromosomal replication initiator protein DnaA [Aerosticca soli]